jgi:uncharacterized protein
MKYIISIALVLIVFTKMDARKMDPNMVAYQEVNIDNTLFGTLSYQPSQKNQPIVLLIAGSGPTDRDGNSVAGVTCDAYKKLAALLNKNGIATLRIDKRGVADSADSLMQEKDLRFDTYIDDAKKWIQFLRDENKFGKIIIAGHSEGSLVAMNAANEADAFISLAGAGFPAAVLLKKQLKGKLGTLESTVMKQLDSLVNQQSVTLINPMLASLFRPSVQPYLMNWFGHDPTLDLQKVKKPVLIVQGKKDMQVGVADAQQLKKAMPKAKMIILPNMNHVLVDVKNNTENTASYTHAEFPITAALAKSVISFCKSVK